MSPRGSIPSLVLASLAIGLVTLGFWWPVLDVGLLSDDWLMPQFLVPGGGPRDVDWAFVLRDFAGPWFGTEGAALYRPLVSVSLGLDIARGGLEEPRVFHVTNLACHVATSVAVTILCHRVAARRHTLTALVGGLVIALHPIGAEPAAWIVARNSGLAVVFIVATTCCFFVGLQTRGRLVRVATPLFALLSFLTKETALVLPLCFVVDVVGQSLGSLERTSLGGFVKRHARWLPVWLAYLGWRIWLFGSLTGEGMGSEPTVHVWLDGIATRVSLLLAVGGTTTLALAIASIVPVACLVRGIASPRALALSIPALLVAGVVGFVIGADVPLVPDSRIGSRVLLVFVPGLALLAPLLTGPRDTRMSLAGLGLLPFLVLSGISSRQEITRYERAGQEMTACSEALRGASDGRSLANASAVLATPSSVQGGVPFLNPNAVFPVVTTPMHTKRTPLIGLNCILLRLPDQPELYHDASPARAVLENAGELLAWIDAQLVAFRPPPSRRIEIEAGADSRSWRTRGLASPFAFEAVTIDLPTGTHEWVDAARLRVLGANGEPTLDEFRARRRAGKLHFDVSRSIHVASLAFSGGVQGFRLEGCPDHVRGELRLVARLETLVHAIPEAATACEVAADGRLLASGGRGLRNPSGDGLRAVLLTAGIGYAFDVESDSEIRFPARVVEGLRNFARSDTVSAFWIYWERAATTTQSSARSELVPLRYVLQESAR